MPIEVEIPDIGVVEFPDSMSEQDISAEIPRLIQQRSNTSTATSPVQQGLNAVSTAIGLADTALRATEVGLIAPSLPDVGSEMKPASEATAPSTVPTTAGGSQIRVAGAPGAGEQLKSELIEGAQAPLVDLTGMIPRPDGRIGALLRTGSGPEKFIAGAATGTAELVEGVANFMLSAQGGTELAATKNPVTGPVVAFKWAKDMVEGGMISFGEAYDAYKSGDMEAFGKHVTMGIGMLGGAGGLAKHQVTKAQAAATQFAPKGQGVELPKPKPLSQQEILDTAARVLARNVKKGELVGGEGALRLELAKPIPDFNPDLYIFAPQTALAVEETIKPNEPTKRTNETKVESTVSEVTPAAPAEAKVEAPRPADVGNEVLTPEQTIADQVNATVTVQKGQVPGQADVWDFRFKEPELEEYSFAVRGGATLEEVQAARERKLDELKPSAPNAQSKVTPPQAAGAELTPVSEGTLSADVPVEAMAQGPGAMTRRESAKPEAPESIEGTGLKHAIDELERTSYGFGERPQQERQAMAKAWMRAGEVQAANPLAGPELAKKLIENPKRGLTGDESALILRHKVALENSLNNAAERTFTAKTPEAKLEAQAEFDAASNSLKEFMDAVNERGSEWGREGRWRQAIAHEDYTFATQERLLRAAKGGEPLTEGERTQLQGEINTYKAKVAQLEKDLAAEKLKNEQANIDDTVKTARAQVKKDKAAGKVRDLEAEQKEVVQHLKETFIENDADLTGATLSIRKLMELLVEREGITERLKMESRVHEILVKEVDPTITREATLDLMSGYGKSSLPNPAFAKRVVRDINAQILSVRKLLDYFKGNRPKLTGQLRDAPSQIQRDWTKMVNEAKKAFKLEDAGNSAQLIKSAIDAINTRLMNRIKDLKSEIVTRQKIIRERQPSPYNAETVRLRQELEQTQQAHKEIFGEPTLTDAQKLDRAEKAAERQIVALDRQIKSGEIFPKSKQAFGLRSDKLDAAKARLEELKMQRQFARESLQPKPEPHEAFALNYLLRLRQRAAEYNERAASGDFTKPVKPVRELSPDVLKAMADVEQSKQNFHKARYEAAQAARSVPRKIWDGIKQTKNAFVNIMSSYDLSAPRQMFLALLANSSRLAFSPLGLVTKKVTGPREAARLMFIPLGRMFKALSSESRSRSLEQWRKNRPNALSGADKLAGIQYTELHTVEFTRWEENAHSVLDEWAQLPIRTGSTVKTATTAVPKVAAKGVRASNRAFITALNTQRAVLFDHLLETNFKDRAPTKVELDVLGNLVNVSTGRGKLSRGVAKVTGEVMWSPSLFASRIQALIGQPLWGGGEWKGSSRARKIVAKEYARWLISGAALYGISRLFDDKEVSDSTSSDAGKAVRGNTRIDPWAGFQQPVVLANRIAQAKSTSIQGKERKLSDYDTGAVIFNFMKNKTRPDIVAAVKVAIAAIDSGKTGKAVRVTPMEAVKSAVPVPLALQEVIAVMRDRGMTEGAIIQVLSEFGFGVNTYEERESQK